MEEENDNCVIENQDDEIYRIINNLSVIKDELEDIACNQHEYSKKALYDLYECILDIGDFRDMIDYNEGYDSHRIKCIIKKLNTNLINPE